MDELLNLGIELATILASKASEASPRHPGAVVTCRVDNSFWEKRLKREFDEINPQVKHITSPDCQLALDHVEQIFLCLGFSVDSAGTAVTMTQTARNLMSAAYDKAIYVFNSKKLGVEQRFIALRIALLCIGMESALDKKIGLLSWEILLDKALRDEKVLSCIQKSLEGTWLPATTGRIRGFDAIRYLIRDVVDEIHLIECAKVQELTTAFTRKITAMPVTGLSRRLVDKWKYKLGETRLVSFEKDVLIRQEKPFTAACVMSDKSILLAEEQGGLYVFHLSQEDNECQFKLARSTADKQGVLREHVISSLACSGESGGVIWALTGNTEKSLIAIKNGFEKPSIQESTIPGWSENVVECKLASCPAATILAVAYEYEEETCLRIYFQKAGDHDWPELSQNELESTDNDRWPSTQLSMGVRGITGTSKNHMIAISGRYPNTKHWAVALLKCSLAKKEPTIVSVECLSESVMREIMPKEDQNRQLACTFGTDGRLIVVSTGGMVSILDPVRKRILRQATWESSTPVNWVASSQKSIVLPKTSKVALMDYSRHIGFSDILAEMDVALTIRKTRGSKPEK